MFELPQNFLDQNLFYNIPKVEYVDKGRSNFYSDRDLHEFLKTFIDNHRSTISESLNFGELQKKASNTLTKQNLFKEICSFKSLINNWDGYGAIPLEIESAANAIFLISSMRENISGSIENIFPNPNGTLSIMWVNSHDETISLEIGNKTMSYYVATDGNETKFFNNIEINDSEINKLSAFISQIV
jgi:hypothetical protein